MKTSHFSIALYLVVFFVVNVVHAQDRIRLAVTTSFENSGLASHILPEIESDLNLQVDLIVVGTGQALRLGRSGDVDAVLVHSRRDEDAFVAKGYGLHRRSIMYNDFVIVGPRSDPAQIASESDVLSAFRRIFEAKSPFISRGDDSGTHRKERALWFEASPDIQFGLSWYREIGASMGATLNMASATNSYTLTDRASWLNFANQGSLTLLFSGDKRLHNSYGFLPVRPRTDAPIRSDLVAKLEAWLTSSKGQAMIADYKILGEQLFFPSVR